MFYKSYLLKFSAILYDKQTYKGGKASPLLAALLRKWTFSYLFFLKSRYFTEQLGEAISQTGGVMLQTYFN